MIWNLKKKNLKAFSKVSPKMKSKNSYWKWDSATLVPKWTQCQVLSELLSKTKKIRYLWLLDWYSTSSSLPCWFDTHKAHCPPIAHSWSTGSSLFHRPHFHGWLWISCQTRMLKCQQLRFVNQNFVSKTPFCRLNSLFDMIKSRLNLGWLRRLLELWGNTATVTWLNGN